MIFSDDFQDIFRKIPSLAEIRSKFRIEDNKTKLGGQFVAQGYISTNYDKKNPSKIGRTSNAEPTPRFGYTPIEMQLTIGVRDLLLKEIDNEFDISRPTIQYTTVRRYTDKFKYETCVWRYYRKVPW